MEFKKLPSNSKKLLDEILQADNSVQMLCERFESASRKEDEELRGILKELREEGLVTVSWASNKPYHVNISNSARTYNERLAEYEAMMQEKVIYNIGAINDKSVNIGDGNKISNSKIANEITNDLSEKKTTFYERHPVVCSFLISLVAGVVVLFSFWSEIVKWIEGVF